MTVRRRSAALSAAFLALATLTVASRDAAAQQPPGPFGPVQAPRPQDVMRSDPNNVALTPDQIRAALLRLGTKAEDYPLDANPLAEAVKKSVLKNNPGVNPKLLDETLKKILDNPQQMKHLRDMAAKHARSGTQPTPNEIGKMFKDLKSVPHVPQNFGEKLGPDIGKNLLNPPKTGSNLGPTLPGVGDVQGGKGSPQPSPGPKPPDVARPGPGEGTQPTPPDKGPLGGQRGKDAPQLQPPGEGGQPKPQPPANPFEQTPEDAARGKAMRALAAAWENNIGPLSETPAVQRALTELVTGMGDLKDADGNSIWSAFDKEFGDSDAFKNWLEGAKFGDMNWKMPSVNWPSFRLGNWGGGGGDSTPRVSSGRSSSGRGGSSGFGSLGIPGLEGSWVPVVLLAAILLGGLIWWRFVYLRDPARELVPFAAGLGPWPIDPRSIATREDVVRAFEYLSVLICGPAAKTWTHATIAEALTGLARTHGEAALLLARLYELARYAPLNEPLTPDELSEARRLVCALAGVAHA